MGGAAAAAEPESASLVSPQFQRQRSLALTIAIGCCSTLCCFDCDSSFMPLPTSTSSSRDVASPTLQGKHQYAAAWHDNWRLLGTRRKATVSQAGSHVDNIEQPEAVLSDVLYTKPSRWRLFLRRLRAQTRKRRHCKSSTLGFQYDALSYAMNFDDGCCSWQQQTLYRSASSATIMETVPLPVPVLVPSVS